MASIRVVLCGVMVLGLGAGCEREPSVEGITEEHREAIAALVHDVASLATQLDAAPTEEGVSVPAGTMSYANTIVVAERDFPALRTDRRAHTDRYDWEPSSTVGPWTSSDFVRLVDAVRAEPASPPDTSPFAVEAMERSVAAIPQIRYVAIVRADEAVGATAGAGRFTNASWRGRVLVRDLRADAWIGTLRVEVDDQRTRTVVGSTNGADDLNHRFNRRITETVTRAVHASAAGHGVMTNTN